MIESASKKHFALRLSPSLYMQIANMAKRNKRSVNSEIEHALESYAGILQDFPLKGSVVKYDEPFAPVAADDWESSG